MVRRGQQAILTCNGLFTSHRTLEQVYERELAFFREPIGTPAGGDYEIDRDLRAVAIGDPDTGPVMRAAFREGIGCVIMAPDQDFGHIAGLPILDIPPPPGDPASIPWHRGRIVHERYAPGFDMHTRTRTWSTAKSLAAEDLPAGRGASFAPSGTADARRPFGASPRGEGSESREGSSADVGHGRNRTPPAPRGAA